MKITKSQLMKIIKEELGDLTGGAEGAEEVMAAITDIPKAAEAIVVKVRTEIEKLAEPSGLDPNMLAQAVAALLTAA